MVMSDRGLGFGAGVVVVRGGDRFVVKQPAHYLVLPGMPVEVQLRRDMAKLMWCDPDTRLIPDGFGDPLG